MLKTITKTYYDETVLRIGTKIHVKRILLGKIEIDDDAEIINVMEAEDCCEIDRIIIKFKTHKDIENDDVWDWIGVDVEDVLSGEWEIQIIK